MLESPSVSRAEAPGAASPSRPVAPLTRRELRERLRLDEASTVVTGPVQAVEAAPEPPAATPVPRPAAYPSRAELRRAEQAAAAERAAAEQAAAAAELAAAEQAAAELAAAAQAAAELAAAAQAAAASVRREPAAPSPAAPSPAIPEPAVPEPVLLAPGTTVDEFAALFGATGTTVEFSASDAASSRASAGRPAGRPTAARSTTGRPSGTGPASGRARVSPPGAVPRRLPAAATAAARGSRFRRAVAKTAVAASATLFAVGLIVSSSVPAASLLSRADIAALQSTRLDGGDILGDPQSVAIAGGPIREVDSEGYTSMTLMEYARAAGIKPAATFTNDPNGTVQWPFKVGVGITDRYGSRDCEGCSTWHHGVDFVPGYGAEIQAIADGTVVYTEEGDGSLGVHMIIEHVIDGQRIASVYAHMQYSSMRFEVGDTVHVGDTVGLVGNTGQSTGPHLHFEIRLGGMDGTYTDPLAWLYANTN